MITSNNLCIYGLFYIHWRRRYVFRKYCIIRYNIRFVDYCKNPMIYTIRIDNLTFCTPYGRPASNILLLGTGLSFDKKKVQGFRVFDIKGSYRYKDVQLEKTSTMVFDMNVNINLRSDGVIVLMFKKDLLPEKIIYIESFIVKFIYLK